MSWFLWILVGFAVGGVVGLICGLMAGDNYWKTKICPYCDHDYQKYLEKKETISKNGGAMIDDD